MRAMRAMRMSLRSEQPWIIDYSVGLLIFICFWKCVLIYSLIKFGFVTVLRIISKREGGDCDELTADGLD